MRVLVVTNLFPTARRPALGPFVRDQLEAMRSIGGADIELHSFDPPGGIAPSSITAGLRTTVSSFCCRSIDR